VHEGREQTVMDDAQQPDEEKRPEDASPTNGEATPAPESAASEPPQPEDPKRPSTLESWLAAAEASKKDFKKPVATGKRDWYILKVQSNREDSIREALQKRVRIQGLEDFFGDIIVPIEKITEFKNGKKRVVKRKLYPGYIVVNMELNDDTWFLVRETGGIGDFTGSGGKPTPMAKSDVEKIVAKPAEETAEAPKIVFKFKKGDRVKINEGMFENFEGDVDGIDEQNGRVTVMINIFGRSTPVELEYWQLENL
jgi:transcriptional antiterminator NusG